MTVADSASRAGNVAAPDPIPGQAHATVSLPPGWGSFRSESRRASEPPHWYAVAPWNSFNLRETYPGLFEDRYSPFRSIVGTVDADSWEELVSAVAEQVELHERLMAEVGE